MEEYIKLNRGNLIPRLGMGTWYLGDNRRREQEEISAIRAGIDEGLTLIDTAEMYGEGRSETLIGKAIKEYDRNKLFLVSKVYPHNAGRSNIFKSFQKTIDRLGTDYLDLYLLHWRGNIPLSETVSCMEELVSKGKIKNWGVSNFDKDDMEELWEVPEGRKCAVNQVLYHLGSRGVEYDLLPWLKEKNVPLMAYCPLAQAGDLKRNMLKNPVLLTIAEKYKATPYQVLLAFVLRDENVIAIPRSGNKEHVKSNADVRNLNINKADFEALNRAFPAPDYKTHLDIV